jgi:hypothetical protein
MKDLQRVRRNIDLGDDLNASLLGVEGESSEFVERISFVRALEGFESRAREGSALGETREAEGGVDILQEDWKRLHGDEERADEGDSDLRVGEVKVQSIELHCRHAINRSLKERERLEVSSNINEQSSPRVVWPVVDQHRDGDRTCAVQKLD